MSVTMWHSMFMQKLETLDQYREAAADNPRGAAKISQRELLRDDEFFAFDSGDYGDIQCHSSCVDQLLDIPVAETEKRLREKARAKWPGGTVESWSKAMHEGVMTWVGLNPAQLQTPYAELYELLWAVDPRPGQKVVDLGAAYGRMGLILSQLWPRCRFVGFEMAGERVALGNKVFSRLEMEGAELKRGNVAQDRFALPDAEYYFIYDFGSLSDQKKLIAKLEAKADAKKSFSVLARGRGINALIQETAPWLTVDVESVGNTNVYRFV